MDWKKINLTADDFEQGTITSAGVVGADYNSLKRVNSANLRTKTLIPVDRAINIPINPGYQYWVAQFNSEQGYLGSTNIYGWSGICCTKKLINECKYICILIKKDSGNISVSDFVNSLPGYMFTCGEPEFITTSDGLRYTEGRNLITNSWMCSHASSGSYNGYSTVTYGMAPGTHEIIQGKTITVSAQFDVENLVFDDGASGNKRLIIEPSFKYEGDGGTHYCGVQLASNVGASVLKSFHKRLYMTYQLKDMKIVDHTQPNLHIQNVKSGTARISKPMITLGDVRYPYSSAPEDLNRNYLLGTEYTQNNPWVHRSTGKDGYLEIKDVYTDRLTDEVTISFRSNVTMGTTHYAQSATDNNRPPTVFAYWYTSLDNAKTGTQRRASALLSNLKQLPDGRWYQTVPVPAEAPYLTLRTNTYNCDGTTAQTFNTWDFAVTAGSFIED